MNCSVYKRCPKCEEFCYYGGIADGKMPDDYCPTCKENCCELDVFYEDDGCIIILEEYSGFCLLCSACGDIVGGLFDNECWSCFLDHGYYMADEDWLSYTDSLNDKWKIYLMCCGMGVIYILEEA